jgi:hypothetical protein
MSRVILIILAIILVAIPTLADVPHHHNGDQPRNGTVTVTYEEQWIRGHEDDDLFFGAIRKVEPGPDGNLYILDQQQSQVAVFTRKGEFVHYLSREGEGPGECRRPEDLVFLSDGRMGLAQYINGKIITMDLENIPGPTIMPPGFDPTEGGAMSSIRRARYQGGVFVINGVRVQPDGDDGFIRTQYLVKCDAKGHIEAEYLSRGAPSNLMRDGWIEKNNYFPSHERWDLDDQGRLYAATERNEYKITVYDQNAQPLYTFGRDHKPWKRTEEEKQEIRDSLTVLRDGQRIEVEVDVEDNEPAIGALFYRPGNEIWVVTSAGRHDQDEGIFQTYDVFTAEGEYIRQVKVACLGDREEDRLFLLGEGEAVLVRGAVQARRNTFGGSRGEEKEVPIHDLVYLRAQS